MHAVSGLNTILSKSNWLHYIALSFHLAILLQLSINIPHCLFSHKTVLAHRYDSHHLHFLIFPSMLQLSGCRTLHCNPCGSSDLLLPQVVGSSQHCALLRDAPLPTWAPLTIKKFPPLLACPFLVPLSPLTQLASHQPPSCDAQDSCLSLSMLDTE